MEIIEACEVIREHARSIEKRITETSETSILQLFFKTIVERIRCNSQALCVLNTNSTISMLSEHAIGLICRNMLTDLIELSYVFVAFKNDQEAETYVRGLFRSDYKKSIDYWKSMYKNEDCDFDDVKKAFEEKYGAFTNSEASKIKIPSMKEKIKFFSSKKDLKPDAIVDEVYRNVDKWIILSKYEHVGHNYYFISRVMNKNSQNFYCASALMFSCLMLSHIYLMMELKIAETTALMETRDKLRIYLK